MARPTLGAGVPRSVVLQRTLKETMRAATVLASGRSPESQYFVQTELQKRVDKQFPGCFLSKTLKNHGKGNACLLTGIDSPLVPAKTDVATTVLASLKLNGMAGKPWVLLDASSPKWEGLLRFG